MLKLVFSPRWFYGIDSIFELIAILVLILIAISSFRLYKFSKTSYHKWFGLSFVSIAISFIFKILTNITIYYDVLQQKTIGILTLTFKTVKYSDIPFIIGYDLNRFFFLLSLLGLYFILYHKNDRQHLMLFLYFMIMITLFSHQAYYVFHLTSTLILFFITMFYYDSYKKSKNKCMLILYAFSLLLLSQVLFIFVFLWLPIYAAAEFFQLAGFLILLIKYFSLAKKK